MAKCERPVLLQRHQDAPRHRHVPGRRRSSPTAVPRPALIAVSVPGQLGAGVEAGPQTGRVDAQETRGRHPGPGCSPRSATRCGQVGPSAEREAETSRSRSPPARLRAWRRSLRPPRSEGDLPVHVVGGKTRGATVVSPRLGLDEELSVHPNRQTPAQVDLALQIGPGLDPAIQPGQIDPCRALATHGAPAERPRPIQPQALPAQPQPLDLDSAGRPSPTPAGRTRAGSRPGTVRRSADARTTASHRGVRRLPVTRRSRSSAPSTIPAGTTSWAICTSSISTCLTTTRSQVPCLLPALRLSGSRVLTRTPLTRHVVDDDLAVRKAERTRRHLGAGHPEQGPAGSPTTTPRRSAKREQGDA